MEITYLGHAGFLVETEQTIVVADPWLSPTGAFDSAWMQLPDNQALAPLVVAKLSRGGKARFLYVSHEHGDHFDRELLSALAPRDFTVVIPRFRRAALREAFAGYGAARVVECEDGQAVPVPGGALRLYVQDSALNRDSALLVRLGDRSFLDLNDCKMHDRLAQVRREEGPIDVFTAQFSGAVWHPVCYRYDDGRGRAIARRKRLGKFEAVCRALEAVQPGAFLASAGPACFLDPELFHLNLDADGIFPRAEAFFAYARKRLREGAPPLLSLQPGDTLEPGTLRVREGGAPRLTEADLPAYLAAYAERRGHVLRQRARPVSRAAAGQVLAALRAELGAKLEAFTLRGRVDRPLFVALAEAPGVALRVDFAAGRVTETAAIPATNRYTLEARAADLSRVLERGVTWEEFLLSFRHTLSREPDRYDPLLHGFLAIERADLADFCEAVRAAEARQERLEIEAGGLTYSVQRFCPHQGADLAEGWTQGSCLVCPRHRWRFDLARGGVCAENGASVRATCADAPAAAEPAPAAAHG